MPTRDQRPHLQVGLEDSQVPWVQGFVRNSSFSHTREVISPSCQVSKEGRSPDGPSSSPAASRVAFETTGLTLACAN